MKYRCPFCGNTKPSPNGTGSDVSCCGEVGHAVACNYDDNEGRCTADTTNDDNGDRCVLCEAEYQEEARYWLGKWNAALPSERDPEGYRQSMIDAGRGHLVKGDHNVR